VYKYSYLLIYFTYLRCGLELLPTTQMLNSDQNCADMTIRELITLQNS